MKTSGKMRNSTHNISKLTINLMLLSLSTVLISTGCGSKKKVNPSTNGANSSALSVSPSSATVAYNQSITLQAAGGTAPYTYYLVSGYTLGSINSTTGVFNAGGTAGSVQIQIMDANNSVVTADIQVASTSSSSNSATATSVFSIYPISSSLTINGSLAFNASGGTPPYTYMVSAGGGSFSSNIYYAPAYATTAQITIRDSANTSLVATLIIAGTTTTSTAPIAVNLTSVSVYRSYDQNTGDFFYSKSLTEGRDAGYSYQGIGFKILTASTNPGTVPLYRCVMANVFPFHHFLSPNTTCEGNLVEGPLGYMYTSQQTNFVPLYRFYSTNGTGFHHFETVTYSEGVNAGFTFEGILGYVAQ
jgi:hypothetical protein